MFLKSSGVIGILYRSSGEQLIGLIWNDTRSNAERFYPTEMTSYAVYGTSGNKLKMLFIFQPAEEGVYNNFL